MKKAILIYGATGKSHLAQVISRGYKTHTITMTSLLLKKSFQAKLHSLPEGLEYLIIEKWETCSFELDILYPIITDGIQSNIKGKELFMVHPRIIVVADFKHKKVLKLDTGASFYKRFDCIRVAKGPITELPF